MYRSPYKYTARCTCVFKKKGSWSAGYHTGEDWVCDRDRTLVSPCNGTIATNGYDNSYGYNVIIRTDDNKVIRMCHMASKSKVYGKVKAGELIGIMGNTGNSRGAHLHIELQNSRVWGYAKNLLKPSDYIDFNDFGQAKPVEPKNEEEEDMIFKTINDVPNDLRPAVQHRIDCGALKGNGDGTINITETMARMWTVEDRINPFYANLADVPDYWRDDTAQLIRLCKIKGDGKNEVGKYRQELSAIIAACR